jgi:NADH:ubiquinone oxidoreductase subunit F (NADH-binding)
VSATSVAPKPIASVRRVSAAEVARLLPAPPITSYEAHLEHFGSMLLPGGDPSALITAVEKAGLRGRGGAGFPTAVKLAAVRSSAARRPLGRRRTPLVIANGTEGEPASVKDVALLRLAPHLVLDGMVAAAVAVGADAAVLCLDREGRPARAAVRQALLERIRAGSDPVPLHVAEAPSHYVSGEESALVRWLDGGDAMPTTVPPRPFERGVARRPTLVDNVETLAQVALIARFGARWWRGVGTEDDPGTFLVTLIDGVHRRRVYELPYGVRLGTLLDHAGVDTGHGVLVGGYFGTWLRPDVAASVPLSRAGLAETGASLGCGAIAALPTSVCPLAEMARVTRWLASESAGQCGPCTFGLPAIAGAVEALAAGHGTDHALDDLRRWLPMVNGRGACKLPDGVVRFVCSGVDVFARHIDEHRSSECALTGAPAVLPVPLHSGGWR